MYETGHHQNGNKHHKPSHQVSNRNVMKQVLHQSFTKNES